MELFMKNLKNKELLLMIVIYLFIAILFYVNNATLFINIINPLFWSGIIIFYLCRIKRVQIRRENDEYKNYEKLPNKCIKKVYIRGKNNKKYYICTTLISLAYICIYFSLGIILGFSKSPYNHNIINIIKNILIQVLPIIGIELTRILVISRNKNNRSLIATATILLILIEINYKNLIDIFTNKKELFEYMCQEIIPIIANGILYTYLTLKTSSKSSLIYRVIVKLTILLSPILPNLDWFVLGSLNVLTPTIIYFFYKYTFTNEKRDIRKRTQNIYNKLSFIIAITFSITLVCFMLGLFKYEPIAILSNSMSPIFSRGDIVIFKKVSDEELQELPINSIIVYSKQDQNIAHGIIDKIEKNGKIYYQTKGINNEEPDMKLVETEQIKGIYVFHIKYMGYPSIWLYDYFNLEK